VQLLPSPPIPLITIQHFHSSDVSEIPVNVCQAVSYHQNSACICNLNYRPILINTTEFTSTSLQRILFVALLWNILHTTQSCITHSSIGTFHNLTIQSSATNHFLSTNKTVLCRGAMQNAGDHTLRGRPLKSI